MKRRLLLDGGPEGERYARVTVSRSGVTLGTLRTLVRVADQVGVSEDALVYITKGTPFTNPRIEVRENVGG